ncbi:xanthine dehydrogenase accessory factor [Palleronia aestuarii]|uniref:Xanthine dehydrogenase accessory factor n=1 Tax=Palleronia aestuarii TaxID=568105 RepID=A0A2W7N966_9RHOB|nr:xanthine dehydrogenase accessory protein XdhC [Palleronia aestuarii]PZX16193.1 xanthine dehydrogenase accessory factor [Palleronia aestuarii]
MSFDRDDIEARVTAHGRATRILVVEARGSAPREPGTSMLVWPDRLHGTIGGGALEHDAIARARSGRTGITRHALGPDLGQCCGGSVTLHAAAWDAEAIAATRAEAGLIVYGRGPRPAAIAKLIARAEAGRPVPLQIFGDWVVEPLAPDPAPVWIWGAGHVGQALASVLAPLPNVAPVVIDTAPDRFPDALPQGAARLVAAEPARLATHAPEEAHHLIATYSHEIDLALCDALLRRPVGSIGLIGSATKWARFRSRLRALGHTDAQISSIRCPIGDPSLGKHPQAIAVGVAADLLRSGARVDERRAG